MRTRSFVKTLRSSGNATTLTSIPMRKPSSKTIGKPSPRSSKRIDAKKAVESQPSSSNRKPRNTIKKTNVRPVDPYELSADENESPTLAVGGSPMLTATATVDKKRRFFPNRGEGLKKRTTLSAFELLRQKLAIKPRGSRRPALLTNLASSSSRTAPMRESERARIVATTIWLPIPPQQCASTRTISPPKQLQPHALSPPDEGCEALTANPSIRLSNISVAASPLISRKALPSSTPLQSTAVMALESSGYEATPLGEMSNIFPLPRPSSIQSAIEKNCHSMRRISFAQPLSPIHKHSAGSNSSSNLSASARKTSLHDYRGNEDTSNYNEWLAEFNSQLKPYEDFNLTID